MEEREQESVSETHSDPMESNAPVVIGTLAQSARWVLATLIVLAGLGLWNLLPSLHIYVSDLEEIEVIETSEWTDLLEMPTYRLDASVDGNSLMIDGMFYSKGIGMHAISEIKVKPPSGYTHFVSEIGIDDEVPEDATAEEGHATVRFYVYGDGVILYESPVVVRQAPPRRIVVDIRGVRDLRLRVDDAGDGINHDHADWGNARFERR